MGVMKRKLLFTAIIAAVAVFPAMAEVSVQEMTDAEYVINSGYSEQTAEDIFMQKNRVTGNPVEPLYTKKHNKLVNFYKRVWGYFDSSIDEADRLHHDIEPSPSYKDL